MKARILRNTGRDLPRFCEGDIVDDSDNGVEELIALGLAERIGEAKKPRESIKAVPEATKIISNV